MDTPTARDTHRVKGLIGNFHFRPLYKSGNAVYFFVRKIGEEYMKIILNDCQNLEERVAKIDSAIIINKLKTLHCSEEIFSPVMKKIIKKDNLPAVMTKLLASKTK